MLVTQRKNLSAREKFLKQSGQQRVDKQVFGKRKIEGCNDVRSFCLATISVTFGNCTALRVWKGKGIMGP